MTNMKHDDLRFVDPAFVEAFRANLLDMYPQFGWFLARALDLRGPIFDPETFEAREAET